SSGNPFWDPLTRAIDTPPKNVSAYMPWVPPAVAPRHRFSARGERQGCTVRNRSSASDPLSRSDEPERPPGSTVGEFIRRGALARVGGAIEGSRPALSALTAHFHGGAAPLLINQAPFPLDGTPVPSDTLFLRARRALRKFLASSVWHGAAAC